MLTGELAGRLSHFALKRLFGRLLAVHVGLIVEQALRLLAYFVHFHLQLRLPIANVLDLAHASNRSNASLRRWQPAKAVLRQHPLGHPLWQHPQIVAHTKTK